MKRFIIILTMCLTMALLPSCTAETVTPTADIPKESTAVEIVWVETIPIETPTSIVTETTLPTAINVKIINTQLEFNTMIASPNWQGADDVVIVGGYGDNSANTTLFSAQTNGEYCFNSAIIIPSNVRNIQGINNAEIYINSTTNFDYEETPYHADWSVTGLVAYKLYSFDYGKQYC